MKKIDSLTSGRLALCIALCIAVVVGPALAQPSYAVKHETIRGWISSFDGHYGLMVRDERGYLDRVTLRDGTVINPTGLRLASGMQVTIIGQSSGNAFVAFEIDAPYAIQPPAYAPAYAPPPYAPPYPDYAYPYPPPAYYPVYPTYPVYYPYPIYSVGVSILIGGHRSYGRRR